VYIKIDRICNITFAWCPFGSSLAHRLNWLRSSVVSDPIKSLASTFAEMAGFNKTFEELTNPDGEFLSKKHAVTGDSKTGKSCSRPGLVVMQNTLEKLLGKEQTQFKKVMTKNRKVLVADVVKLASEIEDAHKKAFIKDVVNNRQFWDSCSEPAKKWLKTFRKDDGSGDTDSSADADDRADDDDDEAEQVV
jgi:hypothetical protein